MVMTLALLVYSVAQRRLRAQLAKYHATVPNQINQPTASPTLRWGFQLLEGIHRVRMSVQNQVHDLIEGLNDVQINILRCLVMRSAVFITFLPQGCSMSYESLVQPSGDSRAWSPVSRICLLARTPHSRRQTTAAGCDAHIAATLI